MRVYEYEVLSLIDDTVFDLLKKSPLLIETAILDGQDGPVLLFGAVGFIPVDGIDAGLKERWRSAGGEAAESLCWPARSIWETGGAMLAGALLCNGRSPLSSSSCGFEGVRRDRRHSGFTCPTAGRLAESGLR